MKVSNPFPKWSDSLVNGLLNEARRPYKTGVLDLLGQPAKYKTKRGETMWRKNGKGQKFVGHYQRDHKGERIMILIGFTSKGEVRTITAESWQMLKAAGWRKVK